MTTGTHAATGEEPLDEQRPASTIWRVRTGAFYLVTAATLVLAVVMTWSELQLAFTGWFADLGIHQVHDMTIFSMLWIAIVAPMALLLYRPQSRVNTVLAPLVVLLPLAAFAALADSPILMLPAIFGLLALLVLARHPAGRDLLRSDRVDRFDRRLAALALVAAIPLLVYAGDQVVRQLTVGDEHALFAHFGGMAVASVFVVVMGALAVVRERDWRFAAWSAGLMAVLLGAVSILFETASSVGPIWGGLAVIIGVTFVAAVEYVRHTGASAEPSAPDPETRIA